MRVLIKTLILFFAPVCALAQANYKPGYIVNLKGDTVRGYIDYKGWALNPVGVIFRTNAAGSRAQKFNSNAITAFGINNRAVYRRFTVSISHDPVALAKMFPGIDTTAKTDSVFLKLLTTGDRFSLYEYTDLIKNRYYLQSASSTLPYELPYRAYFSRDHRDSYYEYSYRTQFTRISQLLQLNNPKLDKAIETAAYTEADLRNVVDLINGESSKPMPYPSSARFFAGLGANLATLRYSGETPLASNATNKASLLPKIDIGVDLFQNPEVSRVGLRGEISLTAANYETSGSQFYANTTVTNTQQFAQYSASFKPKVIVNLYNTDGIKFRLGAGMNANFSVYKDKAPTLTSSNQSVIVFIPKAPLKNVWFNFSTSAGLVFSRKFEVYTEYNLPANIADSRSISIKPTFIQFGLHYFLGSR